MKRKGISPQFDEGMILDCLSPRADVNSVGPLQSAAMMALIDAFDRRIERPFFCNLGSVALALHTAMGRLHTTNAIRGILADAGHPTGKEMDNILANVTANAEQRRVELQGMVKLLVQCPTENDPIS